MQMNSQYAFGLPVQPKKAYSPGHKAPPRPIPIPQNHMANPIQNRLSKTLRRVKHTFEPKSTATITVSKPPKITLPSSGASNQQQWCDKAVVIPYDRRSSLIAATKPVESASVMEPVNMLNGDTISSYNAPDLSKSNSSSSFASVDSMHGIPNFQYHIPGMNKMNGNNKITTNDTNTNITMPQNTRQNVQNQFNWMMPQMQQQLDSKDKVIVELTAKNKIFSNSLTKHKTEIEHWKQKHAESQSELTQHKALIHSLQSTLQSQRQERMHQFNYLQASQVEAKMSEINEIVTSLKRENKSKEEALQQHLVTNKRLQWDTTQLKSATEQQRKELQHRMEIINGLKVENHRLVAERTQMESNMKQHILDQEQKQNALRLKLNTKIDECRRIQEQFHKVKQERDYKVQSIHQEITRELNKEKEMTSYLRNIVNEMKPNSLKETMAHLREDNRSLVESLQQTNERTTKQISTLEKSKSTLDMKLSGTKIELESTKKMLENLKREKQNQDGFMKENVQQLRKEIADLNKSLTQMKQENDLREKIIQQHMASAEHNNQEIAGLKVKLQQRECERAKDVEIINKRLYDGQTQRISELEQKNNALELEMYKKNEEWTSLQSSMKDVTTQKETFVQLMEGAKGKIDELTSINAQLGMKIRSLQAELKPLQIQIEILTQERDEAVQQKMIQQAFHQNWVQEVENSKTFKAENETKDQISQQLRQQNIALRTTVATLQRQQLQQSSRSQSKDSEVVHHVTPYHVTPQQSGTSTPMLEIGDLKSKIGQLIVSGKQATEFLEAERRNSDHLRTQLEFANSRISVLEDQLKSTQMALKQMENLRNGLNELELKCHEKQMRMEELEQKQLSSPQRRELQAELKAKEERIRVLEQLNRNRMKISVEDTQDGNSADCEECKLLKQTIKDLEVELRNAMRSRTFFEEQLDETTGVLIGLSGISDKGESASVARRNSNDSSGMQHNDKVARLEKKISVLHKINVRSIKYIEELEASKATLEGTFLDLKRQVNLE